MPHYSTQLHSHFISREQRNREEALCSHYRAIGIQAVAAAAQSASRKTGKTVLTEIAGRPLKKG